MADYPGGNFVKKEKIEFNSFSDFAGYVWDYYKWYIIAGIFLLVAVCSFISEKLSAKEEAFALTVVNAQSMQMQETLSADFSAYAGIDTAAEQTIIFESVTKNQYDYTSQQALTVRIAVGALDCAVMDLPTASQFAANGTFTDLREVLTQAQLDSLSPYILYADRQDLTPEENPPVDEAEVRCAAFSRDAADFDFPVPVALDASASEVFSGAYCYPENDGVVTVFVNTKRPEMAAKFIEYLFSVTV